MKSRLDYEPGVLRVLQTKSETKAFYDKIAKVYDLLSEHSERPLREAGLRLLAAAPGEQFWKSASAPAISWSNLPTAVGPTGRVFGIDLSENMLAQAKELLGDNGFPRQGFARLRRCRKPPLWRRFDGRDIHVLYPGAVRHARYSQGARRMQTGPAARGRIVVVAVSKEGKDGFMVHAYEWTHRHFPNLMDCRPIYAHRGLAAAGFAIDDAPTESMWVPVEIVRGRKDNI